jgi:four helix bundle protein
MTRESSRIEKFEDLQVWQKALKVSKKVFILSAGGPLSREYSLKDQLRRSSLSVVSNIAEGFGRYGKKDFKHYLAIANGSANEVRAQLHLVKELGYVGSQEADELIELCGEVSRMIKGLRNKVQS